MKFSSLLIASILGTAAAFAPAPRFGTYSALNMVEPVPKGAIDRTLNGIDDEAKHEVFDPTVGERSALKRNNNDEVWVPQVSILLL